MFRSPDRVTSTASSAVFPSEPGAPLGHNNIAGGSAATRIEADRKARAASEYRNMFHLKKRRSGASDMKRLTPPTSVQYFVKIPPSSTRPTSEPPLWFVRQWEQAAAFAMFAAFWRL